jgi:hypothetical protein
MRIPVLAAALALVGGAAVAAPASVQVEIGHKLQVEAHKTYGDDEIADLGKDLRRSVERQLARTGAQDGARIELTLVDAVPNHPTLKQMADKPGLSMRSFGLGGAKIEGRIVAPDGAITPVAYKYYGNDIRDAAERAGTWSDADQAFDAFARRLSRGETLASR